MCVSNSESLTFNFDKTNLMILLPHFHFLPHIYFGIYNSNIKEKEVGITFHLLELLLLNSNLK